MSGNAAGTSPHIRLLSPADLAALPPIEWRVKGVLPTRGMTVMYGPSGSGKTFLALDMAAAIAGGDDWFGYRVKQSPVVYVALEGGAGLQNRVKAWEKVNGRKLPNDLSLVLQPVNLLSREDLCALEAVVPKGAVLILDTLNRVTPGADENSPRDMGLIVEAAMQLQAAIQGLVMFVHHPGKNSTKGMRGHSSLPGASDGTINVTKSGVSHAFRLEKVKDGKDGDTHTFTLATADLGVDGFGDPVTSCAVVSTSSAKLIRSTAQPQGKHQRTALDEIKLLLSTATAISAAPFPSTYPQGRPALKLDDCLRSVAAKLDTTSDKQTTRAREALSGLVGKGLVAQQDSWVWLP